MASDTQDTTIKDQIANLAKLSAGTLKSFIKSLDFAPSTDDLNNLIKKRLLEKIHIPERIEDVYKSLHSELRDAVYNDIKVGKRVTYDFEEFTRRFGKCFQNGLSKRLPVRDFEILLPAEIKDQARSYKKTKRQEILLFFAFPYTHQTTSEFLKTS